MHKSLCAIDIKLKLLYHFWRRMSIKAYIPYPVFYVCFTVILAIFYLFWYVENLIDVWYRAISIQLAKKILRPFKRRSLEKKYEYTMYHVKEEYRQGKNNILKYQRKIERLQLEKERIISLLTLKWGDKSRGTFHFQPYNDEIDEVMENFFQQVKLCFKEVRTTR